eukprot:CAMPEP_0170110594 /NCGR_PEP_ID=MMETSP0020_2-20130122/7956_1 /TAXON_ID=98059 /ORGANISM="Dinobryon sp., Strain UTEXLB2267" /LENGTH=572 /DNA_ID=CAMNT_0010335929 /DNA_START=342 /DNA_END=2057 /DNA_ORIENTATION=+
MKKIEKEIEMKEIEIEVGIEIEIEIGIEDMRKRKIAPGQERLKINRKTENDQSRGPPLIVVKGDDPKETMKKIEGGTRTNRRITLQILPKVVTIMMKGVETEKPSNEVHETLTKITIGLIVENMDLPYESSNDQDGRRIRSNSRDSKRVRPSNDDLDLSNNPYDGPRGRLGLDGKPSSGLPPNMWGGPQGRPMPPVPTMRFNNNPNHPPHFGSAMAQPPFHPYDFNASNPAEDNNLLNPYSGMPPFPPFLNMQHNPLVPAPPQGIPFVPFQPPNATDMPNMLDSMPQRPPPPPPPRFMFGKAPAPLKPPTTDTTSPSTVSPPRPKSDHPAISSTEQEPNETDELHQMLMNAEEDDDLFDEEIPEKCDIEWALERRDIFINKRLAGMELFNKIEQLRQSKEMMFSNGLAAAPAPVVDVDDLLLSLTSTAANEVMNEAKDVEAEMDKTVENEEDGLNEGDGDDEDDLYGDLAYDSNADLEADSSQQQPLNATESVLDKTINAESMKSIEEMNGKSLPVSSDSKDSSHSTSSNISHRWNNVPDIGTIPYLLQDMSYKRMAMHSMAAKGGSFASVF